MNITATLLIQVAAFIFFIWLINRLLWKPLTQAMEKRRSEVEAGIKAGEQGILERKEAEAKARILTEKAKAEASHIVGQAHARARVIEEKSRSKAEEEVEKIQVSFERNMEQKMNEARQKLRDELAGLVSIGVRAVIQKECDMSTHSTILGRLETQIANEATESS